MSKSLKGRIALLLVLPVLALFALATANSNSAVETENSENTSVEGASAIFAGGCFWCVESDFDHVPGVLETVSGYTGGETDQPNYKNHHQGRHREAVRITYDPQQITYAELVDIFWRSVDPTDAGGQFCDRGHSYTTAIYTVDESQHSIATASFEELKESGVLKQPIVTAIETVSDFWPAELYHQDYYLKNPLRYKYYRAACGRDSRVKKVWGSDEAYMGIKKS